MKPANQAIWALMLSALLLGSASAQETRDGFRARVFTGASGIDMPYRLFIPKAYDTGGPFPMVMYLHGGGGAGADNVKQISGGNTNGTHIWTTPENQAKHPSFVVAPQLPGSNRWNNPDPVSLSKYAQLATELVRTLRQEFNIDPARIYLTGQSRGGWGTWDIITKRPDLFAAAIPLCGGGNPSAAAAIRDLPIWAFHGARDSTVPVERSREMVEALQQFGSKVKYTEYPEVAHAVWEKAYFELELIDWLFAQRKNK